MKKYKSSLALGLTSMFATLVAVFGLTPQLVQAASYGVSVDTGSGCTSTVNGSSAATVNVTSGSTISLTVTNANLVTAQSIGGPGVPGGSVVNANNKQSSGTTTLSLGTISNQTIITFTPIPSNDSGVSATNNCPLGSSPFASSLTLNPVAAPAPSTPSTSTPSSSTNKPTTTTPTTTTPATTSADTATPASTSQTSITAVSATVTPKSTNYWAWALGALALLAVGGVGVWYYLKSYKPSHQKAKKSAKRK